MKSAVVASFALIVTVTQAAPIRKRNITPQHKSLAQGIHSDEAYDPFIGMDSRNLAGHAGHDHDHHEEEHESSMSMSMKPSEPAPAPSPEVATPEDVTTTEAPSR